MTVQFEEFFEEIVTLLGGGLVDVELCEADVRVALRRAIRTYQQKGPDNHNKAFYKLSVEKDKTEYAIPKETHTIIKIIRPTQWWSAEDPLALAAYNNLFGHQSVGTIGNGDWLSLEFMNQQLEIWQRYMAFDVDFDHDKTRSTIRLHQPPKRNEKWILEMYSHASEEFYMNMLWIQSWTIAECKMILGQAYRKFSGLPDPTGGTVSLSGDQMIQEANETFRQLLEDIENLVSGDVDYYGIYMG